MVPREEILPPADACALAAWFAEAVRAEVAELEKKGGEQRCELHAGRRITPETSSHAIFRFALADDTVVPEDASGILEVEAHQFKAVVVGQNSTQIDVQIESAESLGQFIARALLRVDDLGLLRKLAEVLEAVASGSESVSPLAVVMFHPDPNHVSREPLPKIPALAPIEDEQRHAIEQACASEVTFLWGPPGTGKTYVIAHLIAALVARGERVLVTSHTHAAVDQSIYETGKPPDGPLAGSSLEQEGKIVRIGHVADPKVPTTVWLDHIAERRAQGIQAEIGDLQRKAAPLTAVCAELSAQLGEWRRLDDLTRGLEEAEKRAHDAISLMKQKATERLQAGGQLDECRQQVETATRAWFFRAAKVERARSTLTEAESNFGIASAAAKDAAAGVHDAEEAAESLRVDTKKQTDICAKLPSAESMGRQLPPIEAALADIERRLTELRARLDAVEREVIAQASVVAATLTKCYVGNQLDGQAFDALIVDEISMALPPLLFVAARHATRRVVLVGDFKQLPPIIRSHVRETETGEKADLRHRLGTDAFHLAGIAKELEPTEHPAMTKLRWQRRMLPAIADAAREISYHSRRYLDDHEKVLDRPQPCWAEFLPREPLVIVDTADLYCWAGRQAGSLSRFNLYSAQIAVELAAIAATAIPRPDEGDPAKIGIVTPYAAQRRLLSRLIDALELGDWVRAGTVHTFQGGQADLVIFDTVLDDPYWSARLINPTQSKEVKRDLNVALTRARSKFVLVGSSEWLNRCAKPTSGLGQLWHYLKDHADLVPATDLLKTGFAGRVARHQAGMYQIPFSGDEPVFEILNEMTFFHRFVADLDAANDSIVGLVAYLGEYRWPQIEPHIRGALARGVEVTLIVCVPDESHGNRAYVQKAIRALRELGALVVSATGFHPKNVIIDGQILYTGSINWGSHRGLEELVHRFVSPDLATQTLEYLQARHIRSAAGQTTRPHICPHCNGPTQVINQARPLSTWDKQPMKIGCSDYQNTGCKYLVDIDSRPPFLQPPACAVDGRTKYRRVKRGRGERWECPKHPRNCETYRVVPGDPPACSAARDASSAQDGLLWPDEK